MHNLTDDGFPVRSCAPPRCTAPLDSGFRRNDGGYAQHPWKGEGTHLQSSFLARRGFRLVLAVLAVVGGSAADAARGGGLVAGWAGGVWGSGDAHSCVVGVYYVGAAVWAGVGCDVV